MASKRLEVVLAGDPKGAIKAFADVDASASKTGGLLGSLGLGAAGAAAATVAAAGAIGGALFAVGSDFASAYNAIRVQTGATGASLDTLKDDFKAVVSTVPTDFETASKAIGLLHSRLDLSGPPLQALSEQMIRLSRLTKTDVSENIISLTRLFGDWSISTDKQSSTLDEMFRAAQATGTSINDLATTVVQFGAPLRGLGFGFEESVAMLGKWNKEGVNVENVMGAMKKAYGQFSKEFGAKAPEEFRKFVAEISKAPNASAAAAKAIEKLGVRNGPDFAAAVKEGRFAYGDLVDKIKNGTDTIADAAGDTSTFSGKFTLFANTLKVLVEPAAMAVFGAVTAGMGWLLARLKEWGPPAAAFIDSIQRRMAPILRDVAETVLPVLRDGFSRLQDALAGVGGKVHDAVDWLGKPENADALKAAGIAVGTYLAFGFVELGIAAAGAAVSVVAATWPVLAAVAAIAGLAFVVTKAYENLEWFHTTVDTVRDTALRFWNEALVPLVDWLRDAWVNDVWPKVISAVETLRATWPTIESAVLSFYNVALRPLVTFIQDNMEMFKNLGVVLAVVAGVIAVVVVAATLAAITTFVVFVAIVAVVVAAVVALGLLFMRFANVVWDVFNNVRDALGAVIDKIELTIQFFWDLARNIGSAIADAARFVVGLVGAAAVMAYGVAVKVNETIGWFQGLPGRILGAIGDVGGLLWDVGRNIVGGLVRGLESAWGWVTDRIHDLVNLIPQRIRDLLDIKSPSKVMMEIGMFAGQGLAGGLEASLPQVREASSAAALLVVPPAQVNATLSPAPASGAGNVTVVVNAGVLVHENDVPRFVAGALNKFLAGGGRVPALPGRR